jgi:tungstate transport system permease protein
MDFLLQGLLTAIELLRTRDAETFSAIRATLVVSSYSLIASLAIGLPLGFCLGHFDFRLKRQARVVVDTLLSLPTVFVGLVVYALLTRKGPLGDWGLLFTLPGIAIGLTVLALPIVVALSATAVESMDRKLRLTLLSLGADCRQLFLGTLWEARHGILAAAITAYGRVMTEVGIAMMVGGNIKWQTRTITTAIALETNKGEFAMGVALGLVLLAIAFTVTVSVSFLRRRA